MGNACECIHGLEYKALDVRHLVMISDLHVSAGNLARRRLQNLPHQHLPDISQTHLSTNRSSWAWLFPTDLAAKVSLGTDRRANVVTDVAMCETPPQVRTDLF